MRLRIVTRTAKDGIPYGIELLDLDEALRRAALPPVSAVESGDASLPVLKVNFREDVPNGRELTIDDGAIRIDREPYKHHSGLDEILVFRGLRNALFDRGLNVTRATRSTDGKKDLALRVKLVQEPPLRVDEAQEDEESYEPKDTDRRIVTHRQIRVRRGQQRFRNKLRDWYGDRCQVTGSKLLAVLEAAHIHPYRGDDDNHPRNGLLLRSDIHTLFDLDLLGIEPEKLEIQLHPSVAVEYAGVASGTLTCSDRHRPSEEALRRRYERFRQRCLDPTQ